MNKDDVLNGWMNWVKGVKPEAVLKRLSEMWRQIESTAPLKRFVRKIRLAWWMVRDTLSGDYKGLSKADLLLIVAALAYLVLVVDIVPDFIPVLGWMDDCVVLGWVFRRVSAELARYEAYRRKTAGSIEAECVEADAEDADAFDGEFDNLSHGE